MNKSIVKITDNGRKTEEDILRHEYLISLDVLGVQQMLDQHKKDDVLLDIWNIIEKYFLEKF